MRHSIVPTPLRWLIHGIIACAFLTMIGGCADSAGGPGAKVGGDLKCVESRREVFPRVEEEGWLFSFALEVDGYKDRRLPVDIFADNGGGLIPLGSAAAESTYEGSEWKQFPVFVPASRAAGLKPSGSFVVFVRSPSDPRTYLAKSTFNYNWPDKSKTIAWEWLEYNEDAPSAGGGTEYNARLRLRVRGYKGKPMELVLLLADPAGRPITRADGTPLRINVETLTPDYDDTLYGSITLRVPHALLKDLPPNQLVVITPNLICDKTRYEGNVHLQCWAGGSLTTQARTFERESQKLSEQIQHLQKQVDILEKEATHE